MFDIRFPYLGYPLAFSLYHLFLTLKNKLGHILFVFFDYDMWMEEGRKKERCIEFQFYT